MNSQEFVDILKRDLINSSVESIESFLLAPPGRKPDNKISELSVWYNDMDLENRAKIKEIIKESLETAVFGFLCILDGVRAIESTTAKSRLTLTYEKDGQTVVLNSPDDEYLHNLL